MTRTQAIAVARLIAPERIESAGLGCEEILGDAYVTADGDVEIDVRVVVKRADIEARAAGRAP